MELTVWKEVLLKWITKRELIAPAPSCMEQADPEKAFPKFAEQIKYKSTDSPNPLLDFLREISPKFHVQLQKNGRVAIDDYVIVYTFLWRYSSHLVVSSQSYPANVIHLKNMTRQELVYFMGDANRAFTQRTFDEEVDCGAEVNHKDDGSGYNDITTMASTGYKDAFKSTSFEEGSALILPSLKSDANGHGTSNVQAINPRFLLDKTPIFSALGSRDKDVDSITHLLNSATPIASLEKSRVIDLLKGFMRIMRAEKEELMRSCEVSKLKSQSHIERINELQILMSSRATEDSLDEPSSESSISKKRKLNPHDQEYFGEWQLITIGIDAFQIDEHEREEGALERKRMQQQLVVLEKKRSVYLQEFMRRDTFAVQMMSLLATCCKPNSETDCDPDNMFKLLTGQIIKVVTEFRFLEVANKQYELIDSSEFPQSKLAIVKNLLRNVPSGYTVSTKASERTSLNELYLQMIRVLAEDKNLKSTTSHFTSEYKQIPQECSRPLHVVKPQSVDRIKRGRAIWKLRKLVHFRNDQCGRYEVELKLQRRQIKSLKAVVSQQGAEQQIEHRSDQQKQMATLLHLLKEKLVGYVSRILRLNLNMDLSKDYDEEVHRKRLNALGSDLKNLMMHQIAYINRLIAEGQFPDQLEAVFGENPMLNLVDELQQKVIAAENKSLHLNEELETFSRRQGHNMNLKSELRSTRDELHDVKLENLRLRHQLLVSKSVNDTKLLDTRVYAGDLEWQLNEARALIEDRSKDLAELGKISNELKDSLKFLGRPAVECKQVQQLVEQLDQQLTLMQDDGSRRLLELQNQNQQECGNGNQYYKAQIESLKAQLEQALNKLKKQSQLAQGNENQLTKQVAGLESQLDEKEQQVEVLQAESEKHQEDYLSKLQEAKKYKKQVARLERRIEELDKSVEMRRTQEQLEETRRELVEQNQRREQLISDFQKCQELATARQHRLEDSQLQAAELSRSLDFTTTQLNLFKSTNGRLSREVQSFQEQIIELQRQLQLCQVALEQNEDSGLDPEANELEKEDPAEKETKCKRENILHYKNQRKQLMQKLTYYRERNKYLEKQLKDGCSQKSGSKHSERAELVWELTQAREYTKEQDCAILEMCSKLKIYKMRLEEMQETRNVEKAELEEEVHSAEQARMELVKILIAVRKETEETKFRMSELRQLHVITLQRFEDLMKEIDDGKANLKKAQQLQQETQMKLNKLQNSGPFGLAERELTQLETELQQQNEVQLKLKSLQKQLKEANEQKLVLQQKNFQLLEKERRRANDDHLRLHSRLEHNELGGDPTEEPESWKPESGELEDHLTLVEFNNVCLLDDEGIYTDLVERKEQNLNEVREQHSRTMMEYAAAVTHIKFLEVTLQLSEDRLQQMRPDLAYSRSEINILNAQLQLEKKRTLDGAMDQPIAAEEAGEPTPSPSVSLEEMNCKRLQEKRIIGELRLCISKLRSTSNTIAQREHSSRRRLQSLEIELAQGKADLNNMRFTTEGLLLERESYVDRMAEMQRRMRLDRRRMLNLKKTCEELQTKFQRKRKLDQKMVSELGWKAKG